MADVKPVPDDRPRVIPYLTVDGAAEALEFCAAAGGGEGAQPPASFTR